MLHSRTASRPSTIGLWVAPDSGVTCKEQIALLLNQLPFPPPDLILFPEAWMDIAEQDLPHVRSVLTKQFPELPQHKLRCIMGLSVRGSDGTINRQILVDAWGSWQQYTKHTTAPHVAFESPHWTPEEALPVLPDGTGMTICHDMYPSLFAHHLQGRGMRLLLNPSEWPVLRAKWETVLRARAIENHVPIGCAVHHTPDKAHTGSAWLFDEHGDRIQLVDAKSGMHVPYGTSPCSLYIGSIVSSPRLPVEERNPRPSPDPGAIPIRIHRNTLEIREEHVRFGTIGKAGGFTIVPIDDDCLLDPCRWIEPMLAAKGKIMFWVRVAPERLPEAKAIASARAIELCAPSVIDIQGSAPLLVELYNKSKGVRWITPPAVSPAWQFGYTSAFKMLQGTASPPSRWKDHLARYVTLLRHGKQPHSLTP
ncbi:MAG: carbon-nitrogen hydrolase family protein [Candidatus Dormibacteria bacterium]